MKIITTEYLGIKVSIDITDLGDRKVIEVVRSDDFFKQPYNVIIGYLNSNNLRPCLRPTGFTLLLER